MSPKAHQTIDKHFAALQDPRHGNALQHTLLDIVVISICATICGADGWTEVALWGQSSEAWLCTFLALPHGIPSHDTFGRLFARLDPKVFRRCFVSWVRAISNLSHRRLLAMDGKKVRRSHDRSHGCAAIHMVSVWAQANRLVLAQSKVSEKSNEITAMPELLRWLELAGCIVTIDAMGCQTEIAQLVVQQGADYLHALCPRFQRGARLHRAAQGARSKRISHGCTRTCAMCLVTHNHPAATTRPMAMYVRWIRGGL